MDIVDAMFGPPNEMDLLEEANRADEREWIHDLVELRKARDLTQEEVGALMGISQSGVARIESCARDVRLSSLSRYALAVGARVQHFATPVEARTGVSVYRLPDAADFLDDSEDGEDFPMTGTYSVSIQTSAATELVTRG